MLAATLCAMLAVFLGGCAMGAPIADAEVDGDVSTEDAAVYQDLEILESGYDIYDGYVRYAISVRNPNEDVEADYVRVSVVVTAPDGTVKDDSYTLMRALAPGVTAYWTEVAGDGTVTEDDSVEISVSPTGNGFIKPVEGLVAELYTVSDVVVNKMDAIPVLSCKVTLNSLVVDESLDELHPDVAYVLRDANGQIVSGGIFRMPLDVVLGEPVEFETTMNRELSDYTTVEVFVVPQ
jgi:hypothetical protein